MQMFYNHLIYFYNYISNIWYL